MAELVSRKRVQTHSRCPDVRSGSVNFEHRVLASL